MAVVLSILDLAFIPAGQGAREAYGCSVALACMAEALGYRRVWYAEHHNIPTIASSATSVLIAHVAAHTRTIRLGAGGIMLPNHAPLVIAEQFGTLETLHPGRIDLGLGRAPGTDPVTSRALRIAPMDAEDFPSDVLELQGYLGDETRVARGRGHAGQGYARAALHPGLVALRRDQLAAGLGLPYAFASHFAPGGARGGRARLPPRLPPVGAARGAVRHRRLERPRGGLAGGGRGAARAVQRSRVRVLVGTRPALDRREADEVLESPAGRHVKGMAQYSAVGVGADVHAYVGALRRRSRAPTRS